MDNLSLEMKLALASMGAVALLALGMTVAGASEFMVGIVTIPCTLLCAVLFGLGFRADAKREQELQAERERLTREAEKERQVRVAKESYEVEKLAREAVRSRRPL
jgi:hypothetical protein